MVDKLFAEECDSWDEPLAIAGLVFETVCRMLEQIDNNVGHIVRNIDYTYIFKRSTETFETIWSNIEIIEQMAQEKGINLDELDLGDIWALRNMVENEDAEEINRKRSRGKLFENQWVNFLGFAHRFY
jgi:hypothetical protein